MEVILTFFSTYGWVITLIAIVGIIILGVLKYCNIFQKIDEKVRHYAYLGISIGFSVIASAVYLLIEKEFDWSFMLALGAAIYALNQAFYNIFKVTPIRELAVKVLDFIKKIIQGFVPGKEAKKIEENKEEK